MIITIIKYYYDLYFIVCYIDTYCIRATF